MEFESAAQGLASLGSEPRLRVFRALSAYGPDGVAAGELAASVHMPANTLSFHLKDLAHAGLVQSRREGRSIIYSIHVEGVSGLLRFLSVDCCLGNPAACLPIQVCGTESQPPAPEAEQQRVLFICKHNAARSQMAEGLLRQLSGNTLLAYSAGLEPTTVHPMAVQVMDEAGIDIRHQTSKSLRDFMGLTTVHHAVFVCQSGHEDCPQLYPFARRHSRWIIDPPSLPEGATEAEELESFRRVRDTLSERIRQWLKDFPSSQPDSPGQATGS